MRLTNPNIPQVQKRTPTHDTVQVATPSGGRIELGKEIKLAKDNQLMEPIQLRVGSADENQARGVTASK
jgi:hypothetical protein